MINRTIKPFLQQYAKKFPAISIMGPRQSGKTTIAKETFPEYAYFSLENPSVRAIATEDPRKFLESIKSKHGVILDEIQNVPFLLSYIQGIIDSENRPGYFIFTGSHNLLLNQAITQSLAGRVAILTLLPLSSQELKDSNLLPNSTEEMLFTGCYPRLYSSELLPNEWYPSYIQTYIERDVRFIQNVVDLSLFQRFLKLCAGRVGQILNLTSLANDCGISFATARGWISLLEMSYIIFLLQPYYKNFNKRLIKSPKLYFYDTGLACNLLDIKAAEKVTFSSSRGGLMESYVIAEFYKAYYNRASRPSLYFWRDHHGVEIDCLIESGEQLIPVEIKSGMTINNDFFNGLSQWESITGDKKGKKYLVYAGSEEWQLTKGNVVSWQNVSHIVDVL